MVKIIVVPSLPSTARPETNFPSSISIGYCSVTPPSARLTAENLGIKARDLPKYVNSSKVPNFIYHMREKGVGGYKDQLAGTPGLVYYQFTVHCHVD